MQIALWMLCAFVPDAGRLGADDWREREAETRRCENPISAALLPARSDDAEVDLRVKTIRAEQLKWANPLYVERFVLVNDFDRWVILYLAANRSAWARDYGFFMENLFGRAEEFHSLKRRMPLPRPKDYETFNFLCRPPTASDFPRYLDFLDYHHHIAPYPTEK